MKKFQFNLGAEEIEILAASGMRCVWIEEIKSEIKDQPVGSEKRGDGLAELLCILKRNLKIMHPFIPFVTEEFGRS